MLPRGRPGYDHEEEPGLGAVEDEENVEEPPHPRGLYASKPQGCGGRRRALAETSQGRALGANRALTGLSTSRSVPAVAALSAATAAGSSAVARARLTAAAATLRSRRLTHGRRRPGCVGAWRPHRRTGCG